MTPDESLDFLDGFNDSASQAVSVLRDELARLRAIVENLPKTADGVTVTPGMTELYDKYGFAYQVSTATVMKDDDIFDPVSKFYSTIDAAAEAARKESAK